MLTWAMFERSMTMPKTWLTILVVAVLAAPVGANADEAFCTTLAKVSDASVQDFLPIKGEDDDGGHYTVTVDLPFSDKCDLDRALEQGFGELRYQCDFTSLNFANAGSGSLADNVYKVAGLYADMIAKCRPELTRKSSENQWAKVISFVDDKGQKWFDISSMDHYYFVEAFTATKNPNY